MIQMSSVQSTAERVKKIVIENLRVSEEKVVDEARFAEDLEADSLDTVELIMALEEEFKCEIPDAEAEKIRTVKDAIDHLQAHADRAASIGSNTSV